MRSILILPLVAIVAPLYSRTAVTGFSLWAASATNPTSHPRTTTTTPTNAPPRRCSALANPAAQLAASTVSEPVIQDGATQAWDVDQYRTQYSFVWKYGSSLLDLVDWDARPIHSILDVGCGAGELAHALHERAGNDCHVQGMDLDPDMVATAQTLHPHLHFLVGDARSFQLSRPVDLIFSNAALHWVPPNDASKMAHALGRALKPGGQLVVEFGGQGNVYSIVQAVRRAMAPRRQSSSSHAVPDDVDDFWYYPSIADFATELQVHGNIEVIQATMFDRPTPLEGGPDGMANWLRMFGSKFWEGATIAEQERIIADACDMLRPDMYDATKQLWTADYRRIRVVGRKLP